LPVTSLLSFRWLLQLCVTRVVNVTRIGLGPILMKMKVWTHRRDWHV